MKKIYFDDRAIVITTEKPAVLHEGELLAVLTDCKDIPNLLNKFDDTPSVSSLIVMVEDEKSALAALKQCFTPIVAAGGLVQNSHNEVLLIRRFGRWDLPKGKVERGEELESAACREVEEECGVGGLLVMGKLCKTYHVYSMNGKRMLKTTHWYSMSCNAVVLTPQLEESIVDAQWVPIQKVSAYLEETYQTIIDVFRRSGLYPLNNQ